MSDVFRTGMTGLSAAQTALNTIAQNVANANTPGYARQAVQTTTSAPGREGSGYVGNGVRVTGVTAAVSPFLETQLVAARSAAANSSESSALFDQLQGLISENASGVSKNQSNFQSALGQVATNASSVPARQLALSSARTLSNSINSVGVQLQSQKQGAQQSLSQGVAGANAVLGQIAKLNEAIAKSEPRDSGGSIATGSMANDLRAQRQTLVNQLSKYASVSTVEQPEGLNVYMGGSAVVVSNRASTLSVEQSKTAPSELTVGIATAAGQVPLAGSSLGGSIGATMDFIDRGLNQAIAQTNQYAAVVARAVNDQSAKGVDLYGNPGAPLFSVAGPEVAPGASNGGNLSVAVAVDPYQSAPSEYKLGYTSAGGYALTRLSDNKVVAGGATLPLSADGLTLSAGPGSPSDGDSFVIKPFGSQASTMRALVTDPRQLALSSPVATSAAPGNASSATIGPATVVSGLPLNPNLTSPVSIVFTSPTEYTISGPGIGTLPNQPYTGGGEISQNGWSVKINGSPKAGDAFAIKKSNGALGDGANANAITSLLQGRNFAGGTASVADLYANMQSDIGTKASAAQTSAASDASVFSIAQNQRESYSGVNLDEEAADLARWQQIYAANAQVMSVAQKLFENLMAQLG